jgi:hypothetical protein
MMKDHDDGAIMFVLIFTFLLGLWMGFSMGTGRICQVQATVPMLARQVFYTLVGR